MVEPLSLNFRLYTVKLVGVRKFRNFTVLNQWKNFTETTRHMNLNEKASNYNSPTVKFLNFQDTRKLCCNLLKIQTEVKSQGNFVKKKAATGIANSEDPDQTVPLGAV